MLHIAYALSAEELWGVVRYAPVQMFYRMAFI